jgi:hypothetical protein
MDDTPLPFIHAVVHMLVFIVFHAQRGRNNIKASSERRSPLNRYPPAPRGAALRAPASRPLKP